MKPQWRTSAVRALCRRMLDTREFDALPILADALEDAGCDDGELLALFRKADLKPVLAERAVNLVSSEETAAAVRWLEQVARTLGYGDEDDPGLYTYEDIVQAGHEAVRRGQYCWGTDEGADFFRKSDENRRTFFHNWSLVTGVAVPEEVQQSIGFSCAC
jgi:hypothetical protein